MVGKFNTKDWLNTTQLFKIPSLQHAHHPNHTAFCYASFGPAVQFATQAVPSYHSSVASVVAGGGSATTHCGGVYVFARLVPLGAEIDVFVEGSSKGKDHEKLHLKNLRETVE